MTAAFADERRHLSPQGRAALRGGVVGNLVDQVHIFLPLLVLSPALPYVVGAHSAIASGTVVVLAMLLGRPVGALLFGPLSDRLGRTRTTSVAIAGTALCSAGIAVTPTHAVVGAGAIWWILVLRFLGGVFVAGEYSAAIPLAMEWSQPQRRGLMSGAIMAMAPTAQGALALLSWALLRGDAAAYTTWGWRLPFAAAALASLALLAFYRRRVADQHPAAARVRLGDLIVGRHRGRFWQLFGLMTGLWLLTNVTVIALPADLRLPPTTVAWVMAVAACAQAVAMATAGHISTLLGRRRFFVVAGMAAAVAGPPLWQLATTARTTGAVVLGAAALQALTVSAYGPVGAYLSEGFPPAIRSTGYGTAYSLSIVVPALHPFYRPTLGDLVGHRSAVVGLLMLGGLLVTVCGLLGPGATSGVDLSAEREVSRVA